MIGGTGDDDLRAALDDTELDGGPDDDRLYGAAKPFAIGGGDVLAGGEGDDLLSDDRGGDSLSGGAGRDTLEGGRADDYLDGGPDPDRLDAGQGGDVLDAGEGGASDADALDGGPNGGSGNGEDADVVSYADRARGVTVDLADITASQGEPGERDILRGIEHINGGRGDDVLRGDDARNVVTGGAGDDRVAGRGGFDSLGPGPGRDRTNGGRGRDILYVLRDAAPDRIACGRSHDFVDGWADIGESRNAFSTVDPVDLLDADCEWVTSTPPEEEGRSLRMPAQPVVVRRNALTFANPCATALSRFGVRPYTPDEPSCDDGAVRVSSASEPIGRAEFGRRGRVTIRLERTLPLDRATRLSMHWSFQGDIPGRVTYSLEARAGR